MAVLRNTNGSIIQATGRLEARLIAEGWTATDQPASPGLSLVTAASLDALATTVTNAVVASAADRANLRAIVEPMAVQLPAVADEVDQLTATIEATTTATAPKPTPRTDALETWRSEAEPVVDGLHPVATSGAYSALTGRPALHAVATSGAYGDLTGRPTIPAAVEARRLVVNTAALTANTVKNVTVTWPTAMPNATYAVTATVEHATAPQQFAISVISKTTTACVLAVRSTAAVAAAGVNVSVIALA